MQHHLGRRAFPLHALLAPALLLGAPAPGQAQVPEAPGFCEGEFRRDCQYYERIKAEILCEATPRSAAYWADDPFQPSLAGVASYDPFSLPALVERFGLPSGRREWVEEYRSREPGLADPIVRVPFARYEFAGVAIETATTEYFGTYVTKIEIRGADVPLKCDVRVGLPWTEVQATLGLPEPEADRYMPDPASEGCSKFYDPYGTDIDNNGTLCFVLDGDAVSTIVWDATRSALGYH